MPKLFGLTQIQIIFSISLSPLRRNIFVINENQAEPYGREKAIRVMSEFRFYFGQSICKSGLI